MTNTYLLLLLGISIGVGGQLLLKRGMRQRAGFQIGHLLTLIGDWWVIGGFACYAVSALLYFKVLATLDLSLAYPTVSIGYVFALVLSKVIFGEAISPTRWLAVTIICAGVALVGFGG
jgi:multidrug transporter EmrE-like cation transporter